MASVTVGQENGHPLHVYFEDHGSGRPVVLIHGWPLSGRAWEPQVPALVAAGFRVITYDRRGFGRSSQPWGGYDYDTFADDLHVLLTLLDLRDAALVGFSMGGGEVARFVARHGTDRVSRVVFAAAVTPYLYQAPDNPDGGLDDATLARFEAGVRHDRLAFLNDFTRQFFAGHGGAELVSEPLRLYCRGIAAHASPKGTLDCIRAFGCTDFRPDLEQCRLPALVIHGDADAIVPYEVSGARTRLSIPGCRLELIKGAPHGLNLTHPEAFNTALLDFLKG